MKDRKHLVTIGKLSSVLLMFFCLVFLTSINYLLYPNQQVADVSFTSANGSDNNNGFPPSGPTEEKSCSSAVSIVEEMLHETHTELNVPASNYLYLHHIAEAQKIEMFHPELIVPPPKF